MDHMARVQTALDKYGLNGTEPDIKPGMTRIVNAWKARDLPGIKAECDALVRVIERLPKPTVKRDSGNPLPPPIERA